MLKFNSLVIVWYIIFFINFSPDSVGVVIEIWKLMGRIKSKIVLRKVCLESVGCKEHLLCLSTRSTFIHSLFIKTIQPKWLKNTFKSILSSSKVFFPLVLKIFYFLLLPQVLKALAKVALLSVAKSSLCFRWTWQMSMQGYYGCEPLGSSWDGKITLSSPAGLEFKHNENLFLI